MNQQSQHFNQVYTSQISLQLLLNSLVDNLPETIFRNKISVKNNVAAEFKMNADKEKIVPVIDEVLNTVVSNARNTSISITAERYSDIVILSFEDTNNYNGYALQFSLMSVGQSARHVGGDINIYGAQQREATVSFSFPDTQSSC